MIIMYFLGISHMPKPGTQYDCCTQRSPKPYVNYRKRKQYVPSKPVLAFDEFLNELKTEFTTKTPTTVISIAYERWNMLKPFEKEKYERLALHANSDYVMRTPTMDERRKVIYTYYYFLTAYIYVYEYIVSNT